MDAFELSNRVTEEVAALRPVTASFMGVRGHDHRWDDFSPAGIAQWAELLARTRRSLDALAPSTDRWQVLAAEVLRDWCDVEEERHTSGDHRYDLNSIASTLQLFRMVFDAMDMASAEGCEAVVARVEAMPEAVRSYQALLQEGLDRGAVVAVRQVRAALEQGAAMIRENGALWGLRARIAAAATEAQRARLEAALGPACDALGALLRWLETDYLPGAPAHDGVGRERYVRAARRFLGTRIDPEETYAWGWTEVRSILAEMTRVAGEILPGRPLAEVLVKVREDPSLAAPDAESFVATLRERQLKALAALDGTHFDVPAPVRAIEVKLAPRGGSLGAYYFPPSEDFSRPGTVWYACPEQGPYPLFDEVSTAYHEGFPGHHLQIGTQVFLREKLSRWHRLGDGWSGFAEGWALYAERLMAELGYYELPAYALGMLANQLFRALRVVIDIGAHLDLPIPADAPFGAGERWTFERIVDALHVQGGMELAYAKSEATRYLGWPGQAICYKVGERVMLSVREAWRAQQGADAPLKEFHARVLSCGAVALDRVRAQVLAPSDP